VEADPVVEAVEDLAEAVEAAGDHDWKTRILEDWKDGNMGETE
jgi:hypothetical protein